MSRFLSAGYDIRNAFAHVPDDPLPGYALPPGNVTMDSSMCRPWMQPTPARAIPFRSWDEAATAYLSIPPSVRPRHAIYRFLLETRAFDVLAHLIVPEDVEATSEIRLDRCGFDVVSYDRFLRGWQSYVANEGLTPEVLREYGSLTTFSLFESLEAAIRFRDSLDPPDEPAEEAFVAIVERAPPSDR